MNTFKIKSKSFLAIPFFCLLILLGPSTNAQLDKHSQEIGIHFGNFFIAGDVAHSIFPGVGAGIHYRVPVNHSLSFRPGIFYGITYGLDAKPTTDGIYQEPGVFDGYSPEQPWFYAYQTKLLRLNIQGLLELTNLGPDRRLKSFNLFVLGGLGFSSHGTWLNLRNIDNEIYTGLLGLTGYQANNDYNTLSGRRNIRKALMSIYDDTYETPAFKEVGEFRLGDETNIALEVTLGAGISYRISSALNISLEHEVIISDNDYLDGLRWRTQNDVTNNIDLGHYTNIRIAVNLKSRQKKEPLFWTNPWTEKQQLIDSLESRVSLLETGMLDSDHDGVVDAIDEQSNSLANCPVDAKGVTLDSDRDGIADCHDKFPFGDKTDLEKMVADYLKSQSTSQSKEKVSDTTMINARIRSIALKNSLLPFVFFDSDSDVVESDQYAALGVLTDFLRMNKITCLSVIGHTDHSGDHTYNENLALGRAETVIRVLKEEFGIKSIHFTPVSNGENSPLIPNPQKSINESINRRVEFKICD